MFAFYPSAFPAGGVLSYPFGWVARQASGSWLYETHICEITWWIFFVQRFVELSKPQVVQCHGHANLRHMDLPMGQKIIKSGTSGVQTLWNSYLWTCWMDLLHWKFYGILYTFSWLVQCHGYFSICPIWVCPWAQNLSILVTYSTARQPGTSKTLN